MGRGELEGRGEQKLENFLKNSSFPCRVEVFQSRKKKSDLKSRVFTNSTFFPRRVGLTYQQQQNNSTERGACLTSLTSMTVHFLQYRFVVEFKITIHRAQVI